ncbi:hypothetical protein E0H75_17995 [Kribbella capetownensis]|uniref:Uncharacterized protein n=1 Tax=Kribbella capetownensis TaxID=1572659 RepID=A0A4R0JXW6_9ACTN|nr:hypothetical protein [Kribbella capetownensis]TCC50166.1 hypothetical protein E0H75_17995 [Kribbella capetownensis]
MRRLSRMLSRRQLPIRLRPRPGLLPVRLTGRPVRRLPGLSIRRRPGLLPVRRLPSVLARSRTPKTLRTRTRAVRLRPGRPVLLPRLRGLLSVRRLTRALRLRLLRRTLPGVLGRRRLPVGPLTRLLSLWLLPIRRLIRLLRLTRVLGLCRGRWPLRLSAIRLLTLLRRGRRLSRVLRPARLLRLLIARLLASTLLGWLPDSRLPAVRLALRLSAVLLTGLLRLAVLLRRRLSVRRTG